MNITDHCNHLREKMIQLEAEVRSIVSATGPVGEAYNHAALALFHLEDSRRWLGHVIQSHDAAQGAMSAAAMPAPIGSETHPLDKTVEGEVAMERLVPEPMPVSPTPTPPQAQPAMPSALDWANLEDMKEHPMEPQPLDRPEEGPLPNTEAAEPPHVEPAPMPSIKQEDKEGDVNA